MFQVRLYISCPRPGTSHFSMKSWFLVVGNGISRLPICAIVMPLATGMALVSRSFPWTELENIFLKIKYLRSLC